MFVNVIIDKGLMGYHVDLFVYAIIIRLLLILNIPDFKIKFINLHTIKN